MVPAAPCSHQWMRAEVAAVAISIREEDRSLDDRERTYEVLFIADPNLTEEQVDALTATVQGFCEKEGGKVQKVEKWGKKRLAYLVKKQREGSYVLLTVDGKAALVKEVERRMHVIDGILKFITVRVDDELRKAEGRKARRGKDEAKRKGRGTKPAPAAEGGEGVQA